MLRFPRLATFALGLSSLLSSALLCSACASPPVSPVVEPECPDAAPTSAARVAESPPLPPEPVLLEAPWAPPPSVPLKSLVVDQVKSSSVRDWNDAELAVGGPTAPVGEAPAVVRGILLATVYEDPTLDPTPYAFSGPAGVPSWLYFVSDGRGASFAKDVRRKTLDGRSLQVDVALFTPKTRNPWQLARQVHLVELEVNGGKGDATKDGRFVATNVRVLEGSEVLPLDLEGALVSMSVRAESVFEREKHGDREIEKAEAELEPDATRVDPRGAVGLERRVAWDDEKRELSFVHVYRRAIRYQSPARPIPVHCLPGQPCAQMFHSPTFQIGVALGVRQTLSATGVLLEETSLAPRARVTRLQ